MYGKIETIREDALKKRGGEKEKNREKEKMTHDFSGLTSYLSEKPNEMFSFLRKASQISNKFYTLQFFFSIYKF